ncbi:hypothetical protein N5P37_007827 [Trichoderma harzianum]|uniref:Uncharacterized protein n=1 Tax=Trichoderma harzianum CBS 226.95 TaxID=983964 RepID=A0A2T4A406_TRIHA|nr:hypothetical protein M431DRAFT_18995 [Trichoderma harzianum CBS 226.95]KAK0759639.1 hypothetical protein N5P37_007827 [Trichoderma harzianum]PTB51789.1 hypothetical protein M431DRAFT_18995 [Trichoderma harzianum CBS 226.95]
MAPSKPEPTTAKKTAAKRTPIAKKAISKPNSKKYFSANDGIYRSFVRACKNGIEDSEKGPTATQLAGALLGMEDLSEEYLPTEWKDYAEANPEIARTIRRTVAELRTPEGEKFGVELKDADVKMDKYLIISNPDYGAADVEDSEVSGKDDEVDGKIDEDARLRELEERKSRFRLLIMAADAESSVAKSPSPINHQEAASQTGEHGTETIHLDENAHPTMTDVPPGWEDYADIFTSDYNQGNNINDTGHHNLLDPVFQRVPGHEQEEPEREVGQDIAINPALDIGHEEVNTTLNGEANVEPHME